MGLKYFFDSFKIVSQRTKYGEDKQNKKDNYTFLNKNYCRRNQTVLAGDSITEMYNHTEMFEDYSRRTGTAIYNRGISGDTSDRLLERFEDNVLNIYPKNVVLLIGTNDISYGADINFTAENTEKILDLTKAKSPDTNIVLLAVYPVNSKIQNQGRRNNKNIAAINSRLKRLAEEKDVRFADLTDKLSDSEGRLRADFTFDGLHLNAKGYKAVTDNIISLLA